MDTGVLPLERETLSLGSWTMGRSTPASRHMGARPMGSSRRRLGLGQRVLALSPEVRERTAKLTATG